MDKREENGRGLGDDLSQRERALSGVHARGPNALCEMRSGVSSHSQNVTSHAPLQILCFSGLDKTVGILLYHFLYMSSQVKSRRMKVLLFHPLSRVVELEIFCSARLGSASPVPVWCRKIIKNIKNINTVGNGYNNNCQTSSPRPYYHQPLAKGTSIHTSFNECTSYLLTSISTVLAAIYLPQSLHPDFTPNSLYR